MNKLTPISNAAAGRQIRIPLSHLLKSPRNARKTPHSPDAIEAKAASIAAKGILQNLVVEPELDEQGGETGMFFVTIGEGRRLAQCLRAERGEIAKNEPIPCVIDISNDPYEISLDENVTRENMHPADQFEAFRALNEERGMSAEDIAARFGVTAKIVKQRLRLGAVSPKLIQAYRDDELTLEQLMAFCVTDDHDRQESVFARLGSYQREPYHIRRFLTETHVRADDRRARFVGAETYVNAGGQIIRDLFTEDGGGYINDAGLLDAIVLQRLTAIAVGIQGAEGWKWAEGHLDFPYSQGMRRAFPHVVEQSEDDKAALAKAQDELMALSEEWAEADDLPEEIDTKFTELEATIGRLLTMTTTFMPDDIARGGIIVSLLHDGTAKIERGLIRAEDYVSAPEPETVTDEGGDGGDFRDDQAREGTPANDEEPEKPLSEALIKDLTTHRTFALRLTLGEQPEMATRVLVHGLVLDLFYSRSGSSCLDIRASSASISHYADGIDAAPTAQAVQARHDAFHSALPDEPDALWPHILAMEPETLGALLAHCVAITIDAVQQPHGLNMAACAVADAVAIALGLNMAEHWKPTVRSYFGRVTKGHIDRAVREAKGDEAAERLIGLKKTEMAERAEDWLAGTGWLPALLKTVDAGLDDGGEAEEASLSEAAE